MKITGVSKRQASTLLVGSVIPIQIRLGEEHWSVKEKGQYTPSRLTVELLRRETNNVLQQAGVIYLPPEASPRRIPGGRQIMPA